MQIKEREKKGKAEVQALQVQVWVRAVFVSEVVRMSGEFIDVCSGLCVSFW